MLRAKGSDDGLLRPSFLVLDNSEAHQVVIRHVASGAEWSLDEDQVIDLRQAVAEVVFGDGSGIIENTVNVIVGERNISICNPDWEPPVMSLPHKGAADLADLHHQMNKVCPTMP